MTGALRRLGVLAAVTLVALVAGACGASTHSATTSSTARSAGSAASSYASMSPVARSTVVASSAVGQRDIGILLRYGGRGHPYHCGAAVVDSPSGDVIATAAHCVSAAGVTYAFAPGHTPQGTPLGIWPVVSVHTDAAWQDRGDPKDDVAFLTVRPRTVDGRLVSLESVTGALRLGEAPRPGTRVQVVAYPSDQHGGHVTCSATVRLTRSYPTVTCPAFTGSTSGSPFVGPGGTLVGVIGGLQAGGCTSDVSYTSPFTRALRALLADAQDGPGSPLPRSRSHDPCP